MKITILEDQPRFITAIRNALPAEHQITAIMPPQDLNDCVRAIEESEPEVLLLDHNLDTDYTGEDVLSLIDREKIKVIGISSERQNYIEKAMRFSFKDHLPRFGDELVALL